MWRLAIATMLLWLPGIPLAVADPVAGKTALEWRMGAMVGSTEAIWTNVLKIHGKTMRKERLVIGSDGEPSDCGMALNASCPFYDPQGGAVHLDPEFFRLLSARFGAAGDLAQALVVAHEIGHHIQNVTGILPRFHAGLAGMSASEANAMSLRIELQADCFAGIWAHFASREGWQEKGDVDAALDAAARMGDQAMQPQAGDHRARGVFLRGTAQQRRAWFRRGFETGRIEACDVFSAASL